MRDPIFDNVENATTVEQKLEICTKIITEELAKLLPYLPEAQRNHLRETANQILKVDFIYRKHIEELQTTIDQFTAMHTIPRMNNWEN